MSLSSMPVRISSHLVRQCGNRSFSSTSRVSATVSDKVIKFDKNRFEKLQPPPYPYGEALWYKQSNTGLYGGLRIRTGNNVSDKTKTKTRRIWKPNILTKRVYSPALKQHIRIKVAARVLRTIDKVGGIDKYVTGEKTARIKELGPFGWRLRWVILQTPLMRAKMGQQAKGMGISEDIRFERGWMTKQEMYEYFTKTKALEAGEAKELTNEADVLATDGDSAAREESKIQESSKEDDTWQRVEKRYLELQAQAKPIVMKLHNLDGRRGRLMKKYEFTVLRKKGIESTADPELESLREAYLLSRQRNLVDRDFLAKAEQTSPATSEAPTQTTPTPLTEQRPETKGFFSRLWSTVRRKA